MKKIAVFDIDGTIYRDVLQFDITEQLVNSHGSDAQRLQFSKAKSDWKKRKNNIGFWGYNQAAVDLFDEFITSVSPDELTQAIAEIIASKQEHTYFFTTDLVHRMKAEGRILITISGSMRNIVEPFAKALGFDYIVGAELEVIDGKHTGRFASKSHQGKELTLQKIVEEHGLTLEYSVGIGDTHRDITLLEAVDHPIAFNPNAALYEAAVKNEWRVVIERKNMIYDLKPAQNGALSGAASASHGGEHEEHMY